MRKGNIYLQLTGHRKPTTYRCNECSAREGHAVWHATHRGLGEEGCPFDEEPSRQAPALIAAHKLGSNGTRRPRRVKHLNMADLMQGID